MKDDRYYGSDLNRFIDEQCSHEHTCMNIDTLQLKWANKTFRFRESKHVGEKLGDQQRKALLFLAQRVKLMENGDGWDFAVEVIYGNEPYERIYVEDLTNDTFATIEGNNVKKFLELG